MDARSPSLMEPALSPEMAPLRRLVDALGQHPPQCLLFEGGTGESRLGLALWWAARLNCETHPAPCLACPSCLQILQQGHSDVLAFDGRISNKEDTENPGPVRAFTMDNVRALKKLLGDTPRQARLRVVILQGMDNSRDEAANALLKALEEPSPSTVFVLLTPQREQLLPTLVSRSWVLTLPWPHSQSLCPPDLAPLESALAHFLQAPGRPGSGCGWFEHTSAKGAVNGDVAARLILLCQKHLAEALRSPQPASPAALAQGGPLARFFVRLSDAHRAAATELLAQSQEALQCAVNPARVLDWLALQLYARQGSPSQGGR